jgi:hypothetical protein
MEENTQSIQNPQVQPGQPEQPVQQTASGPKKSNAMLFALMLLSIAAVVGILYMFQKGMLYDKTGIKQEAAQNETVQVDTAANESTATEPMPTVTAGDPKADLNKQVDELNSINLDGSEKSYNPSDLDEVSK